MVGIGIVGVGFMGMIHYLAGQRLKGARVAAVCSLDPKKLSGDWRGIHGNFGPAGQQMDLSGVKKYQGGKKCRGPFRLAVPKATQEAVEGEKVRGTPNLPARAAAAVAGAAV